MTFLPMVERELRVLARRPATYRWRWLIGGMAFGLALLLLAFMGIGGGPQRWGQALFSTLMVYAAFVSVLAGLFGTVDLISEERREGTLGLLFLTDLKGYDVVLGKFSAVALNAFYWLLAIIPVLAMPMLIGGVTFGEVARVSLALFNLLFFTMAVGTWTSVRSVEVYRSLLLAGGLLVLFCIVIPLWFSFTNTGGSQSFWAIITCSPTLTLFSSSSAKYGMVPVVYWYSFLSAQLLGWCFLALAIWKVPHVWRQSANETGGFALGQKVHRHDAMDFDQRAKWLDENPALFLMRPQRVIRFLAKMAAVIALLLLLLDLSLFQRSSIIFVPIIGGLIDWFVLVPLKILLVIHACRFFSDAKQAGVFELLLSTPLTTEKIIEAHWLAMRRTFFLPFAVVLLCICVEIIKFSAFNRGSDVAFAFLSAGANVVIPIVDYYLIGWMSAWMALKCKKPGWAPFFTILFALLLPSLTFFLCFIGFLAKPVMLAVARHNVIYDFQRLIRQQYDVIVPEPRAAAVPLAAPPPLS